MKGVLSSVILFFLLCGSVTAGVISPELSNLIASGPADEIAVIINLSDRVQTQDISVLAGSTGLGGKAHGYGMIIKLLKDKALRTQGEAIALLLKRGAKHMKPLWLTNSLAATIPAASVDEISRLPSVQNIEPDAVIQAPVFDALQVTPAAAAAPEWNISRINAPALWNAGLTGSGVVVASLDTGVDVTHPDLQSKWRGGACAVPPDCDSWFDPYASSTMPYDQAGPSFTGHGTGVMGIILGSSSAAYYGVAPDARWISAKIFDNSGSALLSTIISALQWILHPGGNPANAPDIVNNSWGFNSTGCSSDAALEAAIRNIRAFGISVVFSGGNSGPGASTSISPANYKDVFAVGATDYTDMIAAFSSRGPSSCPDRTTSFPNVVAPGTKDNAVPGLGIYTSAPAGTYKTVQGTSFSAPHVSGALALLTGAFPTLTPLQLQTALETSAVPLPPGGLTPNDDYGYGLIDVSAAYRSLFTFAQGNIPVPRIAAIPPYTVFSDTAAGFSSSPVTLLIANQGTADLTIGASPNGVLLSGSNAGDFGITSDSCSGVTLPSLGSCSVSAYFRPGTTGPKSAGLLVSSTDPNTPELNIPLSGAGVLPFIAARVHAGATVGLYSSIRTAYENCTDWDSIKLKNTTIIESSDFNLSPGITFSLSGGYDGTFGLRTGVTVIRGSLTVTTGELTVSDIVLE